jgi:hypothetical protein
VGGELWVNSPPGGPTSIRAELPAGQSEVSGESDVSGESEPSGQHDPSGQSEPSTVEASE